VIGISVFFLFILLYYFSNFSNKLQFLNQKARKRGIVALSLEKGKNNKRRKKL